ncbi:MAG: CDP-alcohol phosphatidyltransferase family protein [Candidatus Omnitrophica bacterium]|nr:CDP-alcohol phosphatidyltransferase family protein [Candidatus Omnitrophota bacterium]
MLRKHLYPKVEPLLKQAATFCSERNLTPNQLTLAGLAVNFLAGWAYYGGILFLGGLLTLLAGLGDLLDGPLARLTGKASRFGAFLDSTVDRYSDFFLFGGLTLHFASEESYGKCLVTLGILLGAFVTSYAKARGENLIPSCTVGLLERAERVLLLALGTLIPPLLPLILGILLVGTHATALQRIFYVKQALKLSEQPPQ